MGMCRHQRPEVAPGVVAVVVVLGPNAVEEVLGQDQFPEVRAILGRYHLEPVGRVRWWLHVVMLPPHGHVAGERHRSTRG